MTTQTLDAVAYLHRQSPPIVHRDLKCENLLVDSAGGVKLWEAIQLGSCLMMMMATFRQRQISIANFDAT